MRITIDVRFNPDASPMAMVTCSARDGHAGKPFTRCYRVMATGALEELEETVSLFMHLAIARTMAHEPLSLFEGP